MNKEIQILTQIVNAPSRKLNAKWPSDIEFGWSREKEKLIDISKLTRDEQADLIIEKLRSPPKPKRTLEDELSDILVKEMTAEIDKEIIRSLMIPQEFLFKGKL